MFRWWMVWRVYVCYAFLFVLFEKIVLMSQIPLLMFCHLLIFFVYFVWYRLCIYSTDTHYTIFDRSQIAVTRKFFQVFVVLDLNFPTRFRQYRILNGKPIFIILVQLILFSLLTSISIMFHKWTSDVCVTESIVFICSWSTLAKWS
jgi:hypothetical protein